METVHVFAGIDGADHGLFVDVLWRRRLHEDAVDSGVGVEIGDHFEQFFLSCFRGQLDLHRVETEIRAGAGFRAYINSRGRIIADKHDGEAGRDSFRFQGGSFCTAFFEDGGGNGLAV